MNKEKYHSGNVQKKNKKKQYHSRVFLPPPRRYAPRYPPPPPSIPSSSISSSPFASQARIEHLAWEGGAEHGLFRASRYTSDFGSNSIGDAGKFS